MSKKKCVILVVLFALLVSMAHEMLGSVLGGRSPEFLVRRHPAVSREVMDRALKERGGCELEWEVDGPIASAARVIGRRVEAFGKPWRLSQRGICLRLEVAGVSELDLHDLVHLVEARRLLGFHELIRDLGPKGVATAAEGEVVLAEAMREDAVSIRSHWQGERTLKPTPGEPSSFLVKAEPFLSAARIRGGSVCLVQAKDRVALRLAFDEAGAKALEEGTSRLVGRKVALVAADRVLAAMTVREAIVGGRLEITGDFDPLELANVLSCASAGDLPARLHRERCAFLSPR